MTQGTCDSLGYTREELIGKPPAFFDVDMPADETRRMGARPTTGETITVESRHRPRDGSDFPVKDANGAMIGVSITCRDISARKQAEAARASLEAQLRESQKMEAIGTLAGGIAHDFNNIIAAILGNVELAVMDAGTHSPVVESLNEIRKASARAGPGAAHTVIQPQAAKRAPADGAGAGRG